MSTNLKGKDVSLAVLTPTLQFPRQVSLIPERRLGFCKLASEQSILLVEDDCDSLFVFHGPTPPALYSEAAPESAVYIGSFSKYFAPGMRLGFMIGSEELISELASIRWRFDRHAPGPIQGMFTQIIKDGTFEDYVFRMRDVYLKRWETLRRRLQEELSCTLTSLGGLSAFIELDCNWSEFDTIAANAKRAGVLIHTARPCFARSPPTASMRLGIGRLGCRGISEGIRRLAACSSWPIRNA